ncbi:hypothetical protein ABDF71_26440 [Ochrobactrum sp. WV_118_8]|uniref:hypothetical protein n=1 Tax=Brucella/Ochrobactrum group TaxID=2826938 RepID=UPI001E583A45|nr:MULTISPECIES: hypothetical protein [Brucella]MCR8493867.1 hypothetical protein [Brucella anthropi]UGQ24432.1 hypothetical protein LRL11_24005 [Brucella anthropi]UYT58134.1 hypothetical protein OHI65_22910 [Brucella sp. MAB-22]
MQTNIANIFLKFFILTAIAAGVAGCGTVKEKTAPCKRPANLTSFAEDIRHDCGPMAFINGDPATAIAAINSIASE